MRGIRGGQVLEQISSLFISFHDWIRSFGFKSLILFLCAFSKTILVTWDF